jgi:hypothetical protein
MGTADLLQRMRERGSVDLIREAKDQRRSLSAFLESLSPTEDADRSGLDAFGRLMREADVVVRSIPEEGIYADTYETFLERAGRSLFTELCWRRYRRAKRSAVRAPLLSSDNVAGSVLRPYVDDTTLIRDGFEPAIPLAEIIAGERGIEGNLFRGIYLNEPAAAQKRFVRIGEAAEIPKVTITVGQRQIDMYKFGRGMELTYEVMRRESLDRIGTMVEEMSVQAEIDKVSVVTDVLINGDGNANTSATSYNLSDLDADAAGELTVLAWFAWLGKWKNPYIATHVLAREAPALAVKTLNTGSANLPLSTLPQGYLPTVRPINRNVSAVIGLGETDDVPDNKLLGLDKRVSVERIYEIGAEIQETERYASNQTEALFMTEVEGYQIRSKNGAKLLDLAA